MHSVLVNVLSLLTSISITISTPSFKSQGIFINLAHIFQAGIYNTDVFRCLLTDWGSTIFYQVYLTTLVLQVFITMLSLPCYNIVVIV